MLDGAVDIEPELGSAGVVLIDESVGVELLLLDEPRRFFDFLPLLLDVAVESVVEGDVVVVLVLGSDVVVDG